MARDGGGEPYTPNLVPQTMLDLGLAAGAELTPEIVQNQLQDLERFLEEEFNRIKTAMLTSTVQAAYGALLVDPPALDQPLVDGVPTLVTGFNGFSPAVPNRVTADFSVGESLIPEEGGIYQIFGTVSSIISSGTEYTLTAAVNGTLSGIFGRVDTSNQTTSIQIILYGMVALNPGDIVTLVVVATGPGGPHTWLIESAVFSLTRISEQNDEPGLF